MNTDPHELGPHPSDAARLRNRPADLPLALRAGIVAMVRAAGGGQ